MESWQIVWRKGFQPLMSTAALAALAKGLREDDPRLLQGATTRPPPLMVVQDWPCEGGCAIGYAGWQGDGKATVGAVEEYFAKLCLEADHVLGEPAACRWFLNYFDDEPRHEVFKELLAEIEAELIRRQMNDTAEVEVVKHVIA